MCMYIKIRRMERVENVVGRNTSKTNEKKGVGTIALIHSTKINV